MKLLLMSQQQISPCKASGAFRAFKGLFLGVRSFVTFQMLESSKRTTTGSTHVRPWFVCLGRRKGCTGSHVDICSLGLRLTCTVRGNTKDEVIGEYVLLVSAGLSVLASLVLMVSLPTVVDVGEAAVAGGESEIIITCSKNVQGGLYMYHVAMIYPNVMI